MPLVPFPKFMPDQSRFNLKASGSIVNCQPTKDGWGPLGSLVGITDALPSAPRGGIAVKTDAGTWRVFAGTASNLYVMDSSAYTWTEASRAPNDYSLADGVFWRFARYGDYLIATAPGSTYPQYIELGSGTQFANLTNATFEAGRVATVGDFLVFAHIDGDQRKLKWSGVNDMTFWTKAQRGSDEQIIPDGGVIQEIISQAQNALIIQESTIRQLVFDPASGLTFRVVVLDPSHGAIAPRSIVNIGPNDFVYLARDGFYRGVQARPIGAERVDRWFFNECASDKYDLVSGTADPFEKMVWWRFEGADGNNYRLGYDWQLDEWCYSTTDALDLFPAATAGMTLTELEAEYGTIGNMPFAIGSRFYKGGIPGLGGFTADYKFGFFDGPNLEAIIETEDKALNYPRRAITGNITILADTDDAQVAIASKETQSGALNYGSYLSRYSGQPYIPSRVSGRWHKFKVRIPSGSTWSNASGIDISFTDGGAR